MKINLDDKSIMNNTNENNSEENLIKNKYEKIKTNNINRSDKNNKLDIKLKYKDK
jgi:nucleoside diphosphate kinase